MHEGKTPRATKTPRDPDDVLTDREVNVLRLHALGYSNTEIGAALGVKKETVRSHLRNTRAKLGHRDRRRLALYAIDRGYVTLDDLARTLRRK